jgi:hypothetical protein
LTSPLKRTIKIKEFSNIQFSCLTKRSNNCPVEGRDHVRDDAKDADKHPKDFVYPRKFFLYWGKKPVLHISPMEPHPQKSEKVEGVIYELDQEGPVCEVNEVEFYFRGASQS